MSVTRDPESSLGFLLNDVSRLLRRNFNRRVQTLGLTQAQWRVLAQLSRNEGINQAGLADLLEVRPITLARLIDRLEKAGWVERRNNPDDRRACRLYLTDRAVPLIKNMQEMGAKTIAEALVGFSPSAEAEFIENLSAIKRNLLAAEAVQEETQGTD